jgi:dethiobiotin synthetase
LRGCFVTGTDTGVGKSVLTAAIVAALRAGGTDVVALKPILTGLEEPPDPNWPHDHELLATIAGCRPEQVALETFDPAVSPHLAAELAGRELALDELAAGIRAAARPDAALVIEGVGGLLVPLGPDASVRDLAQELGLPLVVAARPGLGTINHTLLTLEAARSGGLEVAGVVLTPWPEEPGRIERSNLETIDRLGHVEVRTLGRVASPRPELLAAAGAALPLARWLE